MYPPTRAAASLSDFGRRRRLLRLAHAESDTCFMVPLDHSVSDGPIGTPAQMDDIVQAVADGGGDAIVVHKGRARMLSAAALAGLALVVHVSASTRHAPDPTAKVLVAGAEEALTLGADALSVHVNMGSATEGDQLREMGTMAGECARWGFPLVAMIYPRGPYLADRDPVRQLQHAANLAADLGADVVKLPYAGTTQGMIEVIDSSPLPVLVAGGETTSRDAFRARVDEIMQSAPFGLAVGRNVFHADDARDVVCETARMVHDMRWSRSSPPPGALSGAGG